MEGKMSDPVCTDCGGTGITFQTEKRCACQPDKRYERLLAAFGELQQLAWAVINDVDGNLDTKKPPFKFTAPWASLTKLRECLLANKGLRKPPAALASVSAPAGWQSIETAPNMRTILLFCITDPQTGNWKMETGFRRLEADDTLTWVWEGRLLKPYDHQPTHWQPLPPPPIASAAGGTGDGK
jgi:hypothetical protein